MSFHTPARRVAGFRGVGQIIEPLASRVFEKLYFPRNECCTK